MSDWWGVYSDHPNRINSEWDMNIIESGKLIYNNVKKNVYIVPISDIEDIERGIKVAKDSDISIIFVKSTSGKEKLTVENTIGVRPDLDVFHNGNELIDNSIAEINKNIIVVINAPVVVNLPWRDKVKAIIYIRLFWGRIRKYNCRYFICRSQYKWAFTFYKGRI